MNWRNVILGCLPSRAVDRVRERERQARLHAGRVAFYRGLLAPGDLVFDVGANVGERVAAMLEAGCRVVAVEPQAACLERLRRLNARDGRLVIVPKACGAAPGSLVLRSGGGSDVLATLSEDYIHTVRESGRFAGHRWDRSERVEVCTLDALVAEHGMPRFIKIDVEGYEAQVLAGLSTAPEMLSFEYTPELAPGMLACVERCEELGLPEFNISFGESMTFARQSWVTAGRMRQIVDVLEGDRFLFGDIFARKAQELWAGHDA
jgi:FkbM family methyltransferase